MSSALLALLTGVLAACSNQTAASASPPRELRMSALAVADPLIKAAYSRVRNVTIKITSPGGASITNLNDLQQGVTDIVIPLIQQIGSGFLIVGVAGFVIAFVLLVSSWLVTGSKRQSGKIVQIPTQVA